MSTTDIKYATESLADRIHGYNTAADYYYGAQVERFANARWGKLFKTKGTDYVLNFTKTVVDSVLDRLEIASVTGTSDEANAAINLIWEQSGLELEEREIYRNALIYGECFVIVWPDEDNVTRIDYNSPETTFIAYDPENPNKKAFASKTWGILNSFGKPMTRLDLYFDDRVEKYIRTGELDLSSGHENTWSLIETIDHEFGEVPVFHFRTRLPRGISELSSAIGAQDAINKLVMNHMTTVDYLGAPQRYALSNGGNSSELEDFDDDDTARENVGSLGSGPGTVWYMDGVNAVGQFPAAESSNFIQPIQAYVKWMASLTSTPLHFFEFVGTLNSGEAVRNIEGAFTKKIKERQRSFGATWREIFRFVLKIEGIESDVQINWSGVEQIDSTDAWNLAVIKKSVGIPLYRILEDIGYDKEVARQIHDEAEANKQDSTSTAQLGEGVNTHNLALEARANQE